MININKLIEMIRIRQLEVTGYTLASYAAYFVVMKFLIDIPIISNNAFTLPIIPAYMTGLMLTLLYRLQHG